MGNLKKIFCIFIVFRLYYYKYSITDLILLETMKNPLVPRQYSHHKLAHYVDFYLSEFPTRKVKLEVQENCCSTGAPKGEHFRVCPIGSAQ